MTLEKSKKIGILQTGRVSGNLKLEFGEYPEMFMNLLGDDRFTYEVYAVVDGVFPNGPEDCDGWIITGSVHGVYEAHDWIKPLEEFIRRKRPYPIRAIHPRAKNIIKAAEMAVISSFLSIFSILLYRPKLDTTIFCTALFGTIISYWAGFAIAF